MSFEVLQIEPFLPSIEEGEEIDNKTMIKYQIEMARALQGYIRQIVKMINLQLQLMNVGVFHFDLPDINGVYSEGATRLVKVSNGAIELQEADANGNWKSGNDAIAVWDY